MWTEMLQPLQFLFWCSFHIPKHCITRRTGFQIKTGHRSSQLDSYVKKERDWESIGWLRWDCSNLPCNHLPTFSYHTEVETGFWHLHESVTLIKQGTEPRMDMVQHKTTNMIEILKLDTETDACVLPLLSFSASCLMGKVTASVPYSHSYLFSDCL